MRFQSGVTDQNIFFVAVDSTDYVTRETGLSSFTVYRVRDTGAATAYTTPTVTEVSAANMPGVYSLLLDEDMTIGSGNDSEAVVLHITQASMAPVTIMYELYRPLITAGSTITVANSCVDADIERIAGNAVTAASGRMEVNTSHIAGSAVSTSTAQIGVNVVNFGGSAGTFASGRPEVNTSHWRGTAAAAPTVAGVPAVEVIDMSAAGQSDVRAAVGLASANLDTQLSTIAGYIDTEVAAVLAAVDTEVAAIKAKTDLIPGTSDGLTFEQKIILMAAVLLGKASGMATTTAVFRAPDDSKDRITATVDADGNRTAVTLDAT